MKNLSTYFNWLQDMINLRLSDMKFLDFPSLLRQLPAPAMEKEEGSVFPSIVNELKLDEAEQFIALLSLAPYYLPDFINNLSRPGVGSLGMHLNKSMVNNSFYPTIETALALLGGGDVENRQLYFRFFNTGSKLFKEDIIALPTPPHGEPFTRATLMPGPHFLNNIISGENKGPEFSHDFPARAISCEHSWKDLILGYDTQSQLNEVKEWLDYEEKCKQEGIRIDKFKQGYKCLFFGPPGTGKTMAASLIGKQTNKKVYKIDLSAVVSKYIGETEKNLSRIFDRAAYGNWILFFDEADALFGKRGATQNAHDRYANQEVSYLLQRFESYQGVSILASNFKDNIDKAFYRRFHSIVNFRKPEAEERLRLWQVHLPRGFDYDGDVDLEEIARDVKVTGAEIFNVIRRSLMKAVLRDERTISGSDLLDSLKLEFEKENKIL